MHRWVDISEADFGAALINDCKYGYDAVEQLVRLTLLRGATDPYPDPDKGENRMRYALMIHDGISDLERVHRAAERFNNAVAVVGDTARSRAAAPEKAFSFASVDAPNVTIETVKKAETGDALVLRVFETANRRARARISFGIPIKAVRSTNLMEEGAGESVAVTENAVDIALRPFEILTLAVEPRP